MKLFFRFSQKQYHWITFEILYFFNLQYKICQSSERGYIGFSLDYFQSRPFLKLRRYIEGIMQFASFFGEIVLRSSTQQFQQLKANKLFQNCLLANFVQFVCPRVFQRSIKIFSLYLFYTTQHCYNSNRDAHNHYIRTNQAKRPHKGHKISRWYTNHFIL